MRYMAGIPLTSYTLNLEFIVQLIQLFIFLSVVLIEHTESFNELTNIQFNQHINHVISLLLHNYQYKHIAQEYTPKQNILFTKQLSYCTVVCFSVTYDFRHNQYASGRSIASMMQLLLLLSRIESNPGLTKYPCVECSKPVCYGRCIYSM